MENNQWKLSVGCSNGTSSSRDFDLKTHKFSSNEPLNSLEDCIQCVKDWQEEWSKIGYYAVFADAIAPDGSQTNII